MKTIINATAIMLFASIGLISLTAGCSKSNDNNTSPAANEVWLQGSAYNPATLTVAANSTVTWTNKDSYAHTVTSDSTMFDSGNLPADGTYSFKFTTKGTYKYHCTIHSMMKGTIVVQ